MVNFEGLVFWTILVALISSATSYLFMKYATLKQIILNLTDFTKEDLNKWKF